MGELHPELEQRDATRFLADQGSSGGDPDPDETEQLRRELEAFETANPFLFVPGRGPKDCTDPSELEQIRREIEELERRLPVTDITDAVRRFDDLQEKLRAKRSLRAKNKRRAKRLSELGLPCWMFDPAADPSCLDEQREEDCPDPSCLDEQGDYDTEAESDCPGANFNREQVKEILERSFEQYYSYFGKYCELLELYEEDDNLEFPVAPLEVVPVTTLECIGKRGICYHKLFRVHDKSETATTLRCCKPQKMLQVFSLKLSKIQTHPITIYGFFAVRDELEPLRNYLFDRSRDNAFTLEPGCNSLPLCSPCRGIYVTVNALLEVDIRIKQVGDGSVDETLVSGLFDICGSIYEADEKLDGRIHGDQYCLDMHYVYICESVAATIEVFATVNNPSCLRFTACTSGFVDKIVLFDDTFCGAKALFRHVVAVKMESKLELSLQLKVNGSSESCSWSFEPGVYSKVGSEKMLPQGYGFFAVKVFWSVR